MRKRDLIFIERDFVVRCLITVYYDVCIHIYIYIYIHTHVLLYIIYTYEVLDHRVLAEGGGRLPGHDEGLRVYYNVIHVIVYHAICYRYTIKYYIIQITDILFLYYTHLLYYTIDGNMYNLPLYIVAQGRSGSYPVSG